MSTIRKLLPSEDGLLLAHLLRLAPDDRHARFCGHLRDDSVIAFVHGLSWAQSLVLAAVEGGQVRAAALLAGLDSAAGPAELALSVERPWQGRGLGLALARHTLALARNRGIADLRVLCLPDNIRMQRIVRRLSGELAFGHSEVDGQLRLAWPSALTWWQEAALESGAWLDRLRAHVGAAEAA